jgi:hypothetical protein
MNLETVLLGQREKLRITHGFCLIHSRIDGIELGEDVWWWEVSIPEEEDYPKYQSH